MLIWPEKLGPLPMAGLGEVQGPKGLLVQFLRELGPALLAKYKPRAVVVLSAHWETDDETLVSDWGEENPLLYDCRDLLLSWLHTRTRLTSSAIQTMASQTSSTTSSLDHEAIMPLRFMWLTSSQRQVHQKCRPTQVTLTQESVRQR